MGVGGQILGTGRRVCWVWDSNCQPFGHKFIWLTIRPLLTHILPDYVEIILGLQSIISISFGFLNCSKFPLGIILRFQLFILNIFALIYFQDKQQVQKRNHDGDSPQPEAASLLASACWSPFSQNLYEGIALHFLGCGRPSLSLSDIKWLKTPKEFQVNCTELLTYHYIM